MDVKILLALFERQSQSFSDLTKASGKSTYSCYALINRLKELGMVTYRMGKISVINSSATNALRNLVFSNFDTGVFSGNGLKALVLLLEPKTVNELCLGLGISFAHANRLVNKLGQFLDKKGNKYLVSSKNRKLTDFLDDVKTSSTHGVFWENTKTKLLKLPKELSFEGSLTGFSRFPGLGVQIETESNFVVQPAQELSKETVLVHALKFSENANDVSLCIIFYLKNKAKIDALSVEREAVKLGEIGKWQDIVSWLENLDVKNPELFLPKTELKEKARLYKVFIPKRFKLEASQEILKEASRKLETTVKVFLIGGSALMEYGLKNSTKDMDLVVEDERSAHALVKAFKQMGFAPVKGKDIQYTKLGSSMMLERHGSPRIDLFVKNVCNCLDFSKNMVKRSKKLFDGNLEVFNASVEDIFLFKSVSSRDSDIIDSLNILSKKPLNWKTIGKEIVGQEKNLAQLQELSVIDHFEIMEERLGIKIPVKDRVLRQALEKAVLFLCKTPKSVKELKAKLDFPEYSIRNSVARMVKQKKLSKIPGKPKKFVKRA